MSIFFRKFATKTTTTITKTKTVQTILIIDDEQDIREILAFNLEQAGYNTLCYDNGNVNVNENVDLVLLDVMMPGMSGFDLAHMIRQNQIPNIAHDVPIIFLTALGEEDDILRGFDIGADDYISKPFSIQEVLARVQAVLRRKRPASASDIAESGLRLNDKTYTASIDGADIGLTKMEYELLHYLLQHQGAVYSRSDLLEQVWPDNGLVLERTVDVTITRLRKKIGAYKEHLKAKTGYGYYWER